MAASVCALVISVVLVGGVGYLCWMKYHQTWFPDPLIPDLIELMPPWEDAREPENDEPVQP